MGKVLLNQFRAKLAKKIQQHQGLSKASIKIDANDVASKRNQLFISCLSKYLLHEFPNSKSILVFLKLPD